MQIYGYLALMAIAGSLVGLVSSFFGVGACFIMVPVMIYFFESFFGTNPSLAPLIAFGTNMAIVVPTALSGVARHRRELKSRGHAFPLKHFLSFAITVGLGSLLGAITAFTIFRAFRAYAGIVFKGVFGVFCLFGAYRFMRAKPKPISELKPPIVPLYCLAGLLSGFVAHIIGIGGGIIYVPVLNTFLGMPIHAAVPTSLATMVVGSSVGALSFGALGYSDQLLHLHEYPPFSFGWFNLLAFLAIGIPSIVFAQVGPVLAHRTSPRKYKVLFALVYVYIGVRLIVRSTFQLQGLIPPIP